MREKRPEDSPLRSSEILEWMHGRQKVAVGVSWSPH